MPWRRTTITTNPNPNSNPNFAGLGGHGGGKHLRQTLTLTLTLTPQDLEAMEEENTYEKHQERAGAFENRPRPAPLEP